MESTVHYMNYTTHKCAPTLIVNNSLHKEGEQWSKLQWYRTQKRGLLFGFTTALDTVVRTRQTRSPEPDPTQIVELHDDSNVIDTDCFIDVCNAPVLPILRIQAEVFKKRK